MMVIRSSQVPGDGMPETERDVDPLRSGRPSCSPGSLRRTGFPQCARFARSSTSDSPERNGYVGISQHSTAHENSAEPTELARSKNHSLMAC
jgi:hypothetical protein